MKRALQAILIGNEEMKFNCINGSKYITIREGHRNYTEGTVLLGSPDLDWCMIANIVIVRHTILRDVTEDEYKADGFEAKSELLIGFAEWYPEMNWDSEITVVKWE